LEKKKEDLKKRGLSSPDCGDMAAMTFAEKITAPSESEEPYYRNDFSNEGVHGRTPLKLAHPVMEIDLLRVYAHGG